MIDEGVWFESGEETTGAYGASPRTKVVDFNQYAGIYGFIFADF
jgi:hypothetical protein